MRLSLRPKAGKKISLNKVVEVHQPVIGIQNGGDAVIQESPILYGGDGAAGGGRTDELDTLPLSDFERNMARLQQAEEGKGLPEIIGRLEQNYAKERENIYNSGYQAGVEAGQKEMQQQYREDITALEQLIREMESNRWRIQKEAELSLVNLALQVARQVIKAEISQNPEAIRHIIKETLDYARNLEVLALEVNPADYAYILRQSTILDELPENIQMRKNPEIARGGCILHTNMESIDATIETKLDHLAEQLYQNVTEEG